MTAKRKSKSNVVQVRVDDELSSILQAISQQSGQTTSDLIRAAIDGWFKSLDPSQGSNEPTSLDAAVAVATEQLQIVRGSLGELEVDLDLGTEQLEQIEDDIKDLNYQLGILEYERDDLADHLRSAQAEISELKVRERFLQERMVLLLSQQGQRQQGIEAQEEGKSE